MFNTLANIHSLIPVEPEKAQTMLEKFISMIRHIACFDSRKIISLEEELNIAKAYLELESHRFGDRIQWNIVPVISTQKSYLIPQLLLQPLLENSVNYNIAQSIQGGKISIKCTEISPAKMQIEIDDICFDKKDNEKKMMPRPVKTGMGMATYNIRQRIKLIYHDQGELITESGTGRYCVKLILPRYVQNNPVKQKLDHKIPGDGIL